MALEVPAQGPVTEYTVGSWNLEHFKLSAKRGFPENTYDPPGPTYPKRTDANYLRIAQIIQQLDVKILLLQEINAKDVELEGEEAELFGETDFRSPPLDLLVEKLGRDHWDYVVGEAGGSQHLAILYDSRFARLNDVCEAFLPEPAHRIQGKGLFDRQPLYAHFTLLENGVERNDLVVVNVHLASGQRNHRNHDAAMKAIAVEIREARSEEFCIPSDEHDVLIGGDFNANRFSSPQEAFWDDMETNGWDVLGDDGASYPATRLSGVPLQQRTSKIDYIIVTQHRRNMFGFGPPGLQGEEISADKPTVHAGLIGADPEKFRREASDHLPLTVSVRVMDDTD